MGVNDVTAGGGPATYGRLAGLSWPEAAELFARRPVILLPIGSTEAHGPHLPLDTDVRISEAVADRAARALSRLGCDAWVAPALSYGVTDFGTPFPGTVTLRPETLEAMLVDVCLSLLNPGVASDGLARLLEGEAGAAGGGPCALVLINSHLELEHVQVLRRATKRLNAFGAAPVLFADQTRSRWVGTLTEEFRSASCHAGSYETSLMLAAHPGSVRVSRLGLPEVFADLAAAMRQGARTFAEAGAADAYCGAPADATQAEGEATYSSLVAIVLAVVSEALPERFDAR